MTRRSNLLFFANKNTLAAKKAVQRSGNADEPVQEGYGRANEDRLPSISRQMANHLLNRQARVEYELLKSRILNDVVEMNKGFDPDDQMTVREYKLCMSVRYRQQVFIMEFRQLPGCASVSNYALDLIFQGSVGKFNEDARTTLVLARENKHFIWRPQLQHVLGGQASTTQMLAGLILRWFQDQTDKCNFVLNN